jgi:hypothetical protein
VTYVTVWLSLALFAIAETGKGAARGGRSPRSWAFPASAAGLLFMLAHITLAMGVVHGWSHGNAVAATAQQTRAVFGLDWGGGVYINYLFVAVWAAELALWRLRGVPSASWLLRAFYFVIIFNAAVVFAAGWRRALGAAVVLTLATLWIVAPRPFGPSDLRTFGPLDP